MASVSSPAPWIGLLITPRRKIALTTTGLNDHFQPTAYHSLLRHRPLQTLHRWCWNINQLPIDYAFRPRLRVRLTLGGFTVPRNPWVCGEQDSHLLSRYLFRHNRFRGVQRSLPSSFTRLERSPTRAQDQRSHAIHSFGCALKPRSFSAQNLSTSELLRTL